MSKERTSISDTDLYRERCKKFATDDEAFAAFKRDSVYTQILEHATKEQAEKCIPLIVNSGMDLSKLEKLATNDDQGFPTRELYKDNRFDSMSPSTIRYIKVLADMIEIYSDLTNFRIAEIGVGYGGQCKVLNDYFKLGAYDLIDLPEVLELTTKYLKKYDYQNVRTWTPGGNEEYDLVISNYAITECDSYVQKFYIDQVIKKSKHGYITCNYISDKFNINSFTKEEFIEEIGVKNLHIIDENPLTFPGNIVLIW